MGRHVGAGSHHRHASEEDIDELRQFVYARTAHEVPKRELAGVILRCLHGVSLLVDVHGAELEHLEILPIQASPLLHKEHRPRALTFNLDGHNQVDDGEQGGQEQDTHKNVQHTLQRPIAQGT